MLYTYLSFLCFYLPVSESDSRAWSVYISKANQEYEAGNFSAALSDYRAALTRASTARERAETRLGLAVSYMTIGDNDQAEAACRRAALEFRDLEDWRQFAIALSGIGEIYRLEYKWDDALEVEQRALQVLRRAHMERSRESANVLRLIGNVWNDRHDFKRAGRSLERARILLETAGASDLQYARILHDLGVVASERRQYARAETLLTEALAIRKSRLGPRHPSVGSSLLGLTILYTQERRYEQASQTGRQALDLMRSFYPPGDSNVINCLIALGHISHLTGNAKDAVGMLEEAVLLAGTPPLTPAPIYVGMLTLYSQYLKEAGELEKARQVAARTQELSSRPRASGSRLTIDALEFGGGSPSKR